MQVCSQFWDQHQHPGQVPFLRFFLSFLLVRVSVPSTTQKNKKTILFDPSAMIPLSSSSHSSDVVILASQQHDRHHLLGASPSSSPASRERRSVSPKRRNDRDQSCSSLATTISTSSRSSTSSSKKSVRFSEEDMTGEWDTEASAQQAVLSVEYSDSCLKELTMDDIRSIWWTKDELEGNRSRQRELIREFQTYHPDYREQLQNLYRDCSSLTITQVLRRKSAEGIIQQKDIYIRGLESKLSKVSVSYRRRHVKKVLDLQHQGGIPHEHSDICRHGKSTEEFLSENSIKNSRPCQMIARLLACVDAVQAQSLSSSDVVDGEKRLKKR